jgi:membrane peptidoglycan carboxypeptidase
MTRTSRVVASRRAARRRRSVAARPRTRRLAWSLTGLVGLTGIAIGLSALTAISTLGVLSSDLPDPAQLRELTFAQPTIVYDRDGTTELGRFQRERRRVVRYEDIPTVVLDATTTAEDRTFWSNAGIDPANIAAAVAENASGEGERGASTITQQLVRARLLPEDIVAPGSDRYLRKVKEILQSLRLTDAFPGEAGKREVITAYLNEIFYGHGAYGIAAAARTYFGVELEELTLAQAALLAGLPKAPSTLDPYRFAEQDGEGRWVVPADAQPVERRDWVLRGLAAGARWTRVSPEQLREALAEPVVLSDPTQSIRGSHFTWQVERQLRAILGPDADLETGGYHVTTTLDRRTQAIAEKWLEAVAIVPHLPADERNAWLERRKIPRRERSWIRALRDKDLHNASLVAIDHRTGDVLAYVGSADYDRDDLASRRFDPKYDVAGIGARQPGSAFKPILYAAAFEAHALTPGSLLLDITTEFDRRQDWAPRDADRLDRGPVLVRRALQYSLNVPAIRALERVGNETVADTAMGMGLRFAGGRDAFLQAGLAGALGTVETTTLDLTSAYATIANGGVHLAPRMIRTVRSADGRIVWQAPQPDGEAAISPGSAWLVSDILAGNTDPSQNPIWADALELRNGPDGARRPAAVKTGTTDSAQDLGTYGFLPAPGKGEDGFGLTVGVWIGNSDHSTPRTRRPATSLTAAAPLWRAFVTEVTKDWPVAKFRRPDGVTSATIDAWSGGRPGAWTRDTRKEWFLDGTQPGKRGAVDEDGLLYVRACGGWRVDPVAAELGPRSWDADVADWLRRARRGTGVEGRHESRTAYFWGERSWGGPLAGACYRPKPKPKPDKVQEPPGQGKPPKDPPGDDKPKPPKPPDDGAEATPPPAGG